MEGWCCVGGNVNEELLALDAAFSGMVSSAVTAGMFTGGMVRTPAFHAAR